MTVREISKTTLSVLILIVGIVFFRLFYVKLLSGLIKLLLHIDEYAVIIGRLFPNNFIGAYFPSLFYFSVMIIIITCILDIILEHKVAFKIISSFKLILFLTILLTIPLCIGKINLLQLWAIFYFCLLICLHSAFKKIMFHSESAGKYANLKLIKGFSLTIKDTILKVISTGIRNFNNPIDETIVLSASAVVLLLEITVLISFIIFLRFHWRLIFLSHLITQ